MKIFGSFISVVFIFSALFGGSHLPVKPENPIEVLVADLVDDAFSCDFLDNTPGQSFKKNLIGAWQMSLVSVNPKINNPIPLYDPIKSKSTWKIFQVYQSDPTKPNRLTLEYDGTYKWYNDPPLINLTASLV